MPLFDVQCESKHTQEILLKPTEPVPDCPCGAPRKKLPSLVARTSARWGDCSMGGVNGHYDASLGGSYRNSMERDALMKAKGVVHLDDVGGDAAVDAHFDRQKRAEKANDNYMATYQTVMKETQDPILSMTKATEAKELT